MTEFTIEYNYGKGKMTLNLEVFFERKKERKLYSYYKTTHSQGVQTYKRVVRRRTS